MAKYIEKAMSNSTFKIKHKLAPTVIDLPAKKFQNWEKKNWEFLSQSKEIGPKSKALTS